MATRKRDVVRPVEVDTPASDEHVDGPDEFQYGPSQFDLLFAYSEWLDGEGLVKPDKGPNVDKRTHEELVQAFLGSRK